MQTEKEERSVRFQRNDGDVQSASCLSLKKVTVSVCLECVPDSVQLFYLYQLCVQIADIKNKKNYPVLVA